MPSATMRGIGQVLWEPRGRSNTAAAGGVRRVSPDSITPWQRQGCCCHVTLVKMNLSPEGLRQPSPITRSAQVS